MQTVRSVHWDCRTQFFKCEDRTTFIFGPSDTPEEEDNQQSSSNPHEGYKTKLKYVNMWKNVQKYFRLKSLES